MSLVSARRRLLLSIAGYAQEVSSRPNERRNRTHVDHSVVARKIQKSSTLIRRDFWIELPSAGGISSRRLRGDSLFVCVQEITTENIQNNATRPMTVVCAEESEFFVLDKEDYVSSGLDVLQQQESQVRLEFFK